LLTLDPKELRNRIYDFILADAEQRRSTEYHIRYRSHYTVFVASHHPSQPYLGLTQASRQLRSEFLPLYVPSKPTIQLGDASKYLESFPGPNPRRSKQLADAFRALLKPIRPPNAPVINILPILKHWESLPFILVKQSDAQQKHHQSAILEFALWLMGGQNWHGRLMCWFDEISISQRKVQHRIVPVMFLSLDLKATKELNDFRKANVL
jgi:hypothetical protein